MSEKLPVEFDAIATAESAYQESMQLLSDLTNDVRYLERELEAFERSQRLQNEDAQALWRTLKEEIDAFTGRAILVNETKNLDKVELGVLLRTALSAYRHYEELLNLAANASSGEEQRVAADQLTEVQRVKNYIQTRLTQYGFEE